MWLCLLACGLVSIWIIVRKIKGLPIDVIEDKYESEWEDMTESDDFCFDISKKGMK